MPNKVALSTRTHLVPFGVEDFDRLISWLPSEGDLVDWCAAYFRYPLTRSQLDRYLDSSKHRTFVRYLRPGPRTARR